MINKVVEAKLDSLLEKMLGQTIPNYGLLRKVVRGIDDILLASPDDLVDFWEWDGNDHSIKVQTTMRKFREALESSVFDEEKHEWTFMHGFPEALNPDKTGWLWYGASHISAYFVEGEQYSINIAGLAPKPWSA